MARKFKIRFGPIVLFFLFVLNGIAGNKALAGIAYVFIPQTDNALYTDTSNWMGGNYPGNSIAEGDSILFKTGNGFSIAIIDAGVTLFGYCGVDSGVTLYANGSFTLGGLNLFPTFTTDLRTKVGSTFILNGQLTSYARNGVFNGDVIINGNFQARTFDWNDRSGGCEFDFNARLTINGHLGFIASHLNCNYVTVGNTGSFGGSSGYNFWTTSLSIDSLYNSGSVYLREVYFTCSVVQNDSSIRTYTISADSIVNNGQFTISDTSPEQVSNKESSIRRLINSGDIEINHIKLYLATPFVNSQNFVIHDGALVVDAIVNDGAFTVDHTPVIQWGSFINNGSFVWTAIDGSSENKLQANFVNNGVFTHYGKLRVLGGSFTNTGVVNIIPLLGAYSL